jgi:hypothetical protein
MLSGTGLWAQGQGLDGVIEGVVLSADGQAVSSANVRALNTGTGLQFSTIADAAGRYRFPLVPTGNYTLTVEQAGFARLNRENVVVGSGQTARADLRLQVANVNETVTVTEALPPVEVSRTVQSNTIEEQVVRSLPTIGRSIMDFFVMQPGVNARPLSTGGSGTGTATTVYGGLGMRQMNVDGVTNQLQGGARNIVISQEAVAEFQTVTHFSAEFGRVAGGLQNAFTRSGTNEWHGSGYLFARHRELSARPKLLSPTAPTPDFSRYNYGGTIGGPVKKDRMFMFHSYERWQQDLPGILTFNPANAQALGIPASSIGSANQTFRAHTVTSRFDAQLNEKNRTSVRYNYYFDRESPIGSGLVTRETLRRFDEDPWGITAQNVTSISPTMVNELRFVYGSRGIQRGVLNPDAPLINVAGVGQFNGWRDGETITREKGFQLINNFTYVTGRHSLKMGVDLLPVWFRERTTNLNGEFVFGGLPAVANVRPAVSSLQQLLNTEAGLVDPATGLPYSYTRFTRSLGEEFFESRVINQGYFIQDDINLTQNLKVNLGLRYETFVRPQANPNPALAQTGNIPQDWNNFAPRLGVAWDPFGNAKSVIRAGYGIYYQTTVAETFNRFLRENGAAVLSLNVTPGQPGAPAFTRGPVPAITGAQVRSDVRVFAPEFDNIANHSYFLTYEQQILPATALTVTYQGSRARNLPYAVNTNLVPSGNTLPDGRIQYTNARQNTAFNNIFESRSLGQQNYHGLLVMLTRRYSRNLQFQAAWHYSRAEGNAFVDDFSGFGIFTSPSAPENPAFDSGLSDFNMPHRATFTGVYDMNYDGLSGAARQLINGWQLSSRMILQNGFAFNATTGRDDNGDTIFNDRPLGIPYNNFRLPNYFTFDVRLARIFKVGEFGRMEFIAEGFNLANRINPTNVNRVWGINPTPNANFNAVTQAENARQFQLAARFSF